MSQWDEIGNLTTSYWKQNLQKNWIYDLNQRRSCEWNTYYMGRRWWKIEGLIFGTADWTKITKVHSSNKTSVHQRRVTIPAIFEPSLFDFTKIWLTILPHPSYLMNSLSESIFYLLQNSTNSWLRNFTVIRKKYFDEN